MAKRKDSSRTGWSRGSSSNTSTRPSVARASGTRESVDVRPASDAALKRMGPYETSYQVDFGYSSRDIV